MMTLIFQEHINNLDSDIFMIFDVCEVWNFIAQKTFNLSSIRSILNTKCNEKIL